MLLNRAQAATTWARDPNKFLRKKKQKQSKNKMK